jgi:hypothetical protein
LFILISHLYTDGYFFRKFANLSKAELFIGKSECLGVDSYLKILIYSWNFHIVRRSLQLFHTWMCNLQQNILENIFSKHRYLVACFVLKLKMCFLVYIFCNVNHEYIGIHQWSIYLTSCIYVVIIFTIKFFPSCLT